MIKVNFRQVNRRAVILSDEFWITVGYSFLASCHGEQAEFEASKELTRAESELEHKIHRFEQRYGYNPLVPYAQQKKAVAL